MRAILPTTAAALLLLTSQAIAQGNTKEELARDPQVRESQMPEPSAQGVRSPEPLPSAQQPQVEDALEEARKTPTDVQGNPVPPLPDQGGAVPQPPTAPPGRP